MAHRLRAAFQNICGTVAKSTCGAAVPAVETPAGRRCHSADALGALTLLLIGASCAPGCGLSSADLTIASRPLVDVNGTQSYAIHVDDRVDLRFRPRYASCGYAILHDETQGRIEDCGPNLGGEFVWPYVFDDLTPAGSGARLRVTGYQQRGLRDVMPVGGRLMESESPTDPPDLAVASAVVSVYVYQSVLEMEIRLPHGTPNWRLSRLTLTRHEGRKTRVRFSKTQRAGFFTVTGPDASNAFRVRYEPRISELNRRGRTEVKLEVADEEGRTTTFRDVLEPPRGGIAPQQVDSSS